MDLTKKQKIWFEVLPGYAVKGVALGKTRLGHVKCLLKEDRKCYTEWVPKSSLLERT